MKMCLLRQKRKKKERKASQQYMLSITGSTHVSCFKEAASFIPAVNNGG